MTNPTPEALARLRQVASAETGSGRMFTLDDAVEIVAYIDRLEGRPEPRHPSSEPLPDAVERVARALAEHAGIQICSDASYRHSSYGLKARAAIAAMPASSGEVGPGMWVPGEQLIEARKEIEALSQREARLVELLDCAVDEHDARFGRYRDRPQHWSNLARAALAEGGEK